MPKYQFECKTCEGEEGPCELTINTPEGKYIDAAPDTCILSRCPQRNKVKWKSIGYEEHPDGL